MEERLKATEQNPIGEEPTEVEPESIPDSTENDPPEREEEPIVEDVDPQEREDWLRSILTPLLADELNCAIVTAWEDEANTDSATFLEC